MRCRNVRWWCWTLIVAPSHSCAGPGHAVAAATLGPDKCSSDEHPRTSWCSWPADSWEQIAGAGVLIAAQLLSD